MTRPAGPGSDARALLEVRLVLAVVAGGLFLSGITIFPALAELRWLERTIWDDRAGIAPGTGGFHGWILTCIRALADARRESPFLFYAGDWLAFAHLMLAVLFLGAMRDPLRNVWVVQFGMICCAGIIPFAWICGPLRGIPWYWRLVDCSFAPLAGLPLWWAHTRLGRMARWNGLHNDTQRRERMAQDAIGRS